MAGVFDKGYKPRENQSKGIFADVKPKVNNSTSVDNSMSYVHLLPEIQKRQNNYFSQQKTPTNTVGATPKANPNVGLQGNAYNNEIKPLDLNVPYGTRPKLKGNTSSGIVNSTTKVNLDTGYGTRPKLNNGEKLTNATKSIGKTAVAMLPVLGETLVQSVKNVKESHKNPNWNKAMTEQKLEEQRLIGAMRGGQARNVVDPTTRQVSPNAELKALQNNIETAKTKTASEFSGKAISSDGFGAKMMQSALEDRNKALEGMTGVSRMLGETGMSIAENLATLPAALLSPMAPAVLMGARASASKAYELSQQGVSANEALLRGIGSGVIETFTEKIPLDNLLKVAKSTSGKAFVKNILKQSGIEATEEGLSYTLNYIADEAAKDPNANFDPKDFAQSVVSGGLSGLFFGIAGSSVSHVRAIENDNRVMQNAVNQDTQEAFNNPRIEGITNDSHTLEMRNTMQEYANSVDNNLVEFAKTAIKYGKNDSINRMNYEISDVAQREVSDIRNLTGIDVDGYSHNIKGNTIKHIEDRHGTNGEHDNSMSDLNNIGRIEYVIDNYDTVELLTDEKGQKVKSSEFKNADGSKADVVLYKKRINGTYYLVEAVPDTKSKKMQVISTYIIKNKEVTPQVASANALDLTSKNEPVTATSLINSNVPQNTTGVNNQYTQNPSNNAPVNNQGIFGDNTVGAAEHNPNSYIALQNEHGIIEQGENPVRDVGMPKKNNSGNFISKFARTIGEAGITTNETVDIIENMVVAGELAYEAITDKKAMQNAVKVIEYEGFNGAVNLWNAALQDNSSMNKNVIALGQMIYNQAVQNKDIALVKKMIADLTMVASSSGRNLQATRMLKKLTPDGKLYTLERSAQSINKELYNKYGENFKGIEIPDEMAMELLKSTGGTDTDAVISKIEQYIAEQIPSTWVDKWNAWRYLSMLGNPRTHIRNLVGNGIFYPAVKIKNAIAMVMEYGTNKTLDVIGKERIERTKAIVKDENFRTFAIQDFNKIKDVISSGGKLNPSNSINDKRRIFNNSVVEWSRRMNLKWLEAEDGLFLKKHYIDSFASALQASGMTAEFINGGSKEADIRVERLRTYAINEAQKATYRDMSELANLLSNTKRKLANSNNKLLNFGGVLMEGTVPFTKTPINILKRGIEYSPAGIIKGCKEVFYDVKQGNITASQAIDDIAAGLTGTGIIAIGAWLASIGLISGSGSDDKKKRNFDSLQGEQNYALRLGNSSYTLDWAAPISLPLFIGVELWNISKGEDPTLSLGTLVDNLTKISDPMINMSMLQGINNVFKAIKYSEGSHISDIVAELAGGYLSQGVPTLFGQIARTADPVRRSSSYIDKNSDTPRVVQKFTQKAQAKLPFLSDELPPYVDQWGRTQENPSFASRAMQNFVSPGYYSENRSAPLDTELRRLYEATGESRVLPAYADKSITYGGKTTHLTANVYAEYAKSKGQEAYKQLEQFVKTPQYKQMSDSEKAKAVSKIYEYANAKAKEKVSDYELDKEMKKYDEAKENDFNPYQYYLAKRAVEGIQGDEGVLYSASRKKKQAIDMEFPFITKDQREALYRDFKVSEKVW